MIDFPSSPTNGQVVTLAGNQYTYNLAKTQWQVTTPSVSTNLGGGSLGTIPYQSAVNTTAMLATSTAGYLLTSNGGGAAPSWQAAPVSLPTQTGNGGRLLTTDGSTASWSTAITISSGNVGIGTSPSATGGMLSVFGTSGRASANISGNANGMSVLNQNGLTIYTNLSGGSTDTTLVAGNTASSYMAFGIHNGTAYSEKARLTSTGCLSIGTTAVGAAGQILATGSITAMYSDKRLKENIKPITNALDKVDTLTGMLFTQNELAESFGYTDKDQQVGVFAQEVQKVLPEAVKLAPFDMDGDGNSKSGDNYLTVQYEKLVPLLIEAIKELRAEVKELRGN